MAQILPYQRQVSDAPGLGFTPTVSSTGAIGQAGQQLAGAIGNYGQMLAERTEKMQAAQSALALATYNNDVRDAHDQVAQGVQDGSISPDKAIETFRSQADGLRSKAFGGLTPMQQEKIGPAALTTTGDLTRNLNVALFQRSQSEAASTIDQYIEQAQRTATRIGPAAAADKVAEVVRFAGHLAGLTTEKQEKLIQSTKEGMFYNAFDAAGVDALTKGDADGLAEVRRQLQSPDGDALDPQKRTTLTHTLFGYEQHVRARQAAAANAADAEAVRRNNAAADIYNQAFELSVSGKTYDPRFIKQATEAAAGTPVEHDMLVLLDGQTAVSGFATKPAPERAAIIERLQSDAAIGGTSPDDQKTLKMLQTVDQRIKTSNKENVWSSAQASGVIQDAPAFDASKPDSAFKILGQRNQDIAKVEQWAGEKVSPFQPQEVMQLEHAVRTMTPEKAAPYLGALGVSIGDPDRINMVAAELDKSNPAMALAMKLGIDKTNAGRSVAEFVLRGAQAIRDKTVKRDDATLTGWRADIANNVRGTLGSQDAEDQVINAAYYTRAAMDIDGIASEYSGFTHMDANAKGAIAMVIGQPMERSGVKTLLPREMDEGKFDAALSKFTPDTLKASAPDGVVYLRHQPVTLQRFSDSITRYGMTRASAGNYSPSTGGAYITTDKEGLKPLLLHVGP